MSNFAVTFGYLTHRIYAGKLDAKGQAFVDKTEVTGQAIWAVGQWLEAHYDGTPYEIFPNLGGPGYRFTIERCPNPRDEGP